MTDEHARRSHRSTPDRPLTLNLSADERESLLSALVVAISEAEVSKDDAEVETLETILSKTVQEGNDD